MHYNSTLKVNFQRHLNSQRYNSSIIVSNVGQRQISTFFRSLYIDNRAKMFSYSRIDDTWSQSTGQRMCTTTWVIDNFYRSDYLQLTQIHVDSISTTVYYRFLTYCIWSFGWYVIQSQLPMRQSALSKGQHFIY